MAPLIVLAIVTVMARLAGYWKVEALRSWSGATRAGLAVMFCFTATAHFSGLRAELIQMVPPAIPAPGFMVTFTGLCEIAGGVGLLLQKTRRAAAVALLLLLAAMLPANIHGALSGATLGGAPVTPLVPRIVLQGVFMVLVWWSGLKAVGGSSS